jgi:hypothetical protein
LQNLPSIYQFTSNFVKQLFRIQIQKFYSELILVGVLNTTSSMILFQSRQAPLISVGHKKNRAFFSPNAQRWPKSYKDHPGIS